MRWFFLPALLMSVLLFGCAIQPATTTTPTTPAAYSQFQLEYHLQAEFPNIFWNDPDLWPVAREGQEQQNAIQQFDGIRSNNLEFTAILEHLDMDRKDNYTSEEKLLIYRQHKWLTRAIQMTPLASGSFRFVLLVGEGQGERIEGTVTSAGKITVEKREPSFNTHPICLTAGTLIATPAGDVAVENVGLGTLVYTLAPDGSKVAEPVLETRSTPVSESYRALSIKLSDGRTILASPSHPSAEGSPLSGYRVGDVLDGGVVVSTELVAYSGSRTYDLLPAGATSLYWANGILLKSTLAFR